MTISEKILARAAGVPSVKPGQYIRARADSIIVCDLGWSLVGPPPIQQLDAKTAEPDRVVVVFDHAVPALNKQSAELHRKWRAFCKDHDITRLHDIGNHGISHVISVENGYARPGTLQVSVDTHANTCGAVGCFATALGMDVISDMVLDTNWYCGFCSLSVNDNPALPAERAINLHDMPQKITIDKSGANTAAIESVKADACVDILMRQNKYLNNIVERDCRGVKRVTQPMLGLKFFWSARILITGIETMHMNKKGQMSCPGGRTMSAANQFYSLAA